jgi:hypothetical protein
VPAALSSWVSFKDPESQKKARDPISELESRKRYQGKNRRSVDYLGPVLTLLPTPGRFTLLSPSPPLSSFIVLFEKVILQTRHNVWHHRTLITSSLRQDIRTKSV